MHFLERRTMSQLEFSISRFAQISIESFPFIFSSFSFSLTSVLPSNDQVAIESVIVAESGDDSDDEWNYIKVDENATKSDKTSPEPERDEETEVSKPVLEDSIRSSTPPTASIGEPEPDVIASQEEFAVNYTDVSTYVGHNFRIFLI